jgi:predicted Na+-dependent transporter
MKKLISALSLILITLTSFAQENKIEMADQLRSSGKIYVVVAVMLLLFVSFIAYLFSIDKRLKKIEKDK